MAIPFLNNINLSDNQLLNAKLQVTGSAPTAAAGQIYFNSTDNVARYHNGTAWVDIPRQISVGGTSLADSQAIDLVAGANVGIAESSGTITISSSDQFQGTVTSVSASTAGDALDVTVTNGTTTPDLAFTWAGNPASYVRGDGTLATFPTIPTVPSNIVETVDTQNGAFIDMTPTGAVDGDVVITADLSASGTKDATTYLRGDNTWSLISDIAGTTYDLDSIQVGSDVAITLVGSNATLDTVTLVAGTNITLTDDGSANITIDAANPDQTVTLTGDVTGTGTTSIATTISAGAVDFAMLNPTDVITSVEGIENNDNDVTIPTSAAVKAYADSLIVGGLIYQGGYDANLNSPDLTTSPNSILKGWTYTVIADGTFFSEQLRVGDVLIAEVDDPSALTDWTTVQNNIDLASLTQVGIGNVNASTDQDKVGLYVSYSSGTANIGVDIDSLTQGLPAGNNTDSFLFYYDNAAAENKKITFAQLSTEINTETSFAGDIGNGSATSIRLENSGATAPNINHGLGTDSSAFMIQLVDNATGETVYADVSRGAGGQITITFAIAPALDGIKVLIQKIG